nr:hypothetical protein [Tanacetum cinerariifolium]
PTVPAEPSSPLRDPSKGKAVATPSLPVTAPTAKELADQQAAILEAERQELLKQELKQSINAEQVYLDSLLVQRTWKYVRGLIDDQLQIVYDKIRRAIDLATAKDHHQHLKRSELQETTSVSVGSPIAAGDPIPAVTSGSASFFVFTASSIPAATPIAAGVFTTAGAFGSASEVYVLIIELLVSPPKDTSLPLDSETKEQDTPFRKSSRKKSIARKRTLPSPFKPKTDALPFDEDDPEAEFKRYLRQASDDDEPAEPVSLALISDTTTWKIIPTKFGCSEIHVITRADGIVKRFSTLRELMYWAGRADLMVLYCLVSNKYKTERAIGIGLGLWMDHRILITSREERDASITWDDQDQFVDKKYPLTPETLQWMLNHGLEIDRDLTGNGLTTAIQLIQSL